MDGWAVMVGWRRLLKISVSASITLLPLVEKIDVPFWLLVRLPTCV